jgi:hypothetical protein
VSAGSAKGRVAELRSILRFLYLQGVTPLRLGKLGEGGRRQVEQRGVVEVGESFAAREPVAEDVVGGLGVNEVTTVVVVNPAQLVRQTRRG